MLSTCDKLMPLQTQRLLLAYLCASMIYYIFDVHSLLYLVLACVLGRLNSVMLPARLATRPELVNSTEPPPRHATNTQ